MEKISTELDAIGQYYASTITPDHPGQFMLSAYLKETVDPEMLQEAVNDVMGRLPFLSGCIQPKFFWYHHKLLSTPPQIVWMGDEYVFTDYYNKGDGHALRVLYGERHITVEAIHSVVDGRGMAKVMQTLLGRYFERLGVVFEKGGMIDCAATFAAEEWEDAYVRFYDPSKGRSGRTDKKYPKAYHHKIAKTAPPRVIIKTFNLAEVKGAAKVHGATVSEYMMAQIFSAIAEERNANGCSKPITAMVPVDCRAFFPTKTIRNFVDSVIITMPETDDFSKMIAGLRAQFAEITTEFVQENINEFQSYKNKWRFLPRMVKKWALCHVGDSEEDGLTTTFSSLGKVSLPPEIEARVAHMAFVIDAAEEEMPITYASAATGDTLTLTVTLCTEEDVFVQNLVARMI
ncbi:MAG: hypothetical protein FWE25_04965 [Lachnospiraceae bacterium]|nr:hypothetical protein [Lachnospiraceae bacterium]